MAFKNKFMRDTDRSTYMNDTRAACREEASKMSNLDDAIAKLIDFRTKHIGHQRETYEMEFDSLWMESELESHVSALKSKKFIGKDYLDKCACGADADEVLKEWMHKSDAAEDDLLALEDLVVEYRRGFKPPIMPVNHWLEGDSYLSKKLLLKRSGYVDKMSLEELREFRGIRIVA